MNEALIQNDAVIFGILMLILGAVFYTAIGRIFTNETLVLEQFYTVFWIVLITQPINAITFIFDGMFKGMGYTAFLRNLLLLSTLLVFIPSLLIFDAYNYKLLGVWFTFSLWMIARGMPLLVKFRRKFLPLVEKE